MATCTCTGFSWFRPTTRRLHSRHLKLLSIVLLVTVLVTAVVLLVIDGGIIESIVASSSSSSTSLRTKTRNSTTTYYYHHRHHDSQEKTPATIDIATLLSNLERHPQIRNISRVPELLDPNEPIRHIRPSAIPKFYNWSYVAKTVTDTGHPWCALYRDNHQCIGSQYQSVLRQTPLFNIASYDLNHVDIPDNSRIVVEGNSWMAELVYTIICNTESVQVWLLDGDINNSIFAYTPIKNISLMLISNHYPLNESPENSLSFLNDIQYTPNYIVRGTINGYAAGSIKLRLKHRKIFMAKFPQASYLEYVGRRLPTSCRADFHDCEDITTMKICTKFTDSQRKKKEDDEGGHTCLPGPINAYAEELVRSIVASKSVTFYSPPRPKQEQGMNCSSSSPDSDPNT
eukprot:CAMPEP_0113519022 /NCGR_PEP_ID=MMETSP0014_2-20120614/43297_1 /TAXON_ID=2857 /ORGANISM="Nitzschia sp." /LENGTH=399 /DNA_ID=CAMNT_0000416711 /DNA_START=87 /DNA_END=1286 /DNA_ORIENTATION=+ /assembly_acc=CAM_ASM_000159